MDDLFRQLRRRQDDLANRLDRGRPEPGDRSASFVGQVFNNGSMPASLPGQFAVNPVLPSGTESEGSASSFLTGMGVRIVTVFGTTVPVVGDRLNCYLDGGRWVAEKGTPSGTGPPVNLPGCPCVAVPRTLFMDLNNPTINNINNTWHSCTFQYGPSVPAYGYGANCHLSTTTFADDFQSIYGEVFYYSFRCLGASYEVNRVYHWHPSGPGPDLEGRGFGGTWEQTGLNPQCHWAIGFGTFPNNNRCTPDFHLNKAVGVENGGFVTCQLTVHG